MFLLSTSTVVYSHNIYSRRSSYHSNRKTFFLTTAMAETLTNNNNNISNNKNNNDINFADIDINKIKAKVLSSQYDLIDDLHGDQVKYPDHALHDTLNGSGLVESYVVYRKKNQEEIMCVIKLGGQLNGYPGVVHGGITALLFDNSFGAAFFVLNKPHGVTANLTVNYK